jgi:hypothetical protein
VRAIPDDDTGTAMITLRFDTRMLARVDAAAKRLGIRTAYDRLELPTSKNGRGLDPSRPVR